MIKNILFIIGFTFSLSTIAQVACAQKVDDKCKNSILKQTFEKIDMNYSKAEEVLQNVLNKKRLQSSQRDDSSSIPQGNLFGEQVNAYFNVGILRSMNKNLDGAIAAYKQVNLLYFEANEKANSNFQSDPNEKKPKSSFRLEQSKNADAYIKLGDLYAQKKEYNKAFESYRQAIMINRNYAGILYSQTRELNDALPNNKEEIKIDSKDSGEKLLASYIAKGYLYSRQQRWDEAIRVYDEAIKKYSDIYLYLNRGYLYISWIQSTKRNTTEPNTIIPSEYINIINYVNLNRLKEALKDFELAREKNKTNPFVSIALAKAFILVQFMGKEYDVKELKNILISEDLRKAIED